MFHDDPQSADISCSRSGAQDCVAPVLSWRIRHPVRVHSRWALSTSANFFDFGQFRLRPISTSATGRNRIGRSRVSSSRCGTMPRILCAVGFDVPTWEALAEGGHPQNPDLKDDSPASRVGCQRPASSRLKRQCASEMWPAEGALMLSQSGPSAESR